MATAVPFILSAASAYSSKRDKAGQNKTASNQAEKAYKTYIGEHAQSAKALGDNQIFGEAAWMFPGLFPAVRANKGLRSKFGYGTAANAYNPAAGNFGLLGTPGGAGFKIHDQRSGFNNNAVVNTATNYKYTTDPAPGGGNGLYGDFTPYTSNRGGTTGVSGPFSEQGSVGALAVKRTLELLNHPGSVSSDSLSRMDEQANMNRTASQEKTDSALAMGGIDPNSSLGLAFRQNADLNQSNSQNEANRDFTTLKEGLRRGDIQSGFNNYQGMLADLLGLAGQRSQALAPGNIPSATGAQPGGAPNAGLTNGLSSLAQQSGGLDLKKLTGGKGGGSQGASGSEGFAPPPVSAGGGGKGG